MIATSQGATAAPPSNILGIQSKSIHGQREPLAHKGLRNIREGRYALQKRAQALLWKNDAGKRQKHRVTHCGRSVKGNYVFCYRDAGGENSRFAGLMQCGSGWTCPVCAAKLGEGRRKELTSALVKHVAAGGRVQLLTLTFPHEHDMPLPEIMAKFDKARQHFKNSRTYKRISTAAARLGNVASMEVTYGQNGFHPHLHELVFVGRSITGESVKNEAGDMTSISGEAYELASQWVDSLIKFKLGDESKRSDMMNHALDLRGGEYAAAYITAMGHEEQWGLQSEVIGTGKDGKPGSFTPFGLLKLSIQGEEIRVAGAWVDPGQKFKEFADEFHGKRLLNWSRGLRDHFGLADEAKAEKAAMLEALPEDERIATLSADDWKIVLTRDARQELLDYLRRDCINKETAQADVDDFIESLKRRRQTARGWFWQFSQRAS